MSASDADEIVAQTRRWNDDTVIPEGAPSVWVVTQGDYSDHQVDKVFDNETAAKHYVAAQQLFHPGNSYYLDEYELLSTWEAPRLIREYFIQQNIDRDGGPAGEPLEWTDDYLEERLPEDAAARPKTTVKDCDGGWTVRTRCLRQELGRKAFHDMVAQLMAEAKGVTP